MELMYQKNWETIKKRLTLLWDNEILDRPCVSVACPLDENDPYIPVKPEGQEALKEYYTNPELILKRNLECFEKTYFGGDAFPCIFPYWGTGGHAKYLGPNVLYQPDTIWIDPAFTDYEAFSFDFDLQNQVFQAELTAIKYLAGEGMGRFFVAPPDNCGSYDALSQLRGGEDFVMDLLEEPKLVKKCGNRMVDILIASGNEIFDAIRENNDGGSVHGFYNTWCPGTHMQLQCDLSVMISPEMFEEFILEELTRTAGWLDHAIYHMDGLEQLRHLPMILDVPGIDMIQWVQVAGQPDITRNLSHVRRIQQAGKGLVVQAYKNQLDTIVKEVSPYGLDLLVMDAANPKEADEIVDYVAKNSFRKRLF